MLIGKFLAVFFIKFPSQDQKTFIDELNFLMTKIRKSMSLEFFVVKSFVSTLFDFNVIYEKCLWIVTENVYNVFKPWSHPSVSVDTRVNVCEWV